MNFERKQPAETRDARGEVMCRVSEHHRDRDTP